MNKLAREKSAYLKHSADQKIDWYPWNEEAFRKAKQDDKPLFLSSGAVWCHWCHVMAKESFYDDEIARILNNNFINIKLDRDERPDIDRRYQMAVAVMGAGGGWPLSVFLTFDKKPFFGGTYFPPEDRFGRPGFRKVLTAVLDLYHSKRSDIAEYTDKLAAALQTEPMEPGEIQESMLDNAVESIMSEFDAQHGGFGNSPKFPMPGAIDFLLTRYVITQEESLKHAVKKTLESMAAGGFYDHLGGGFHRYSTDEAWIIPHFEKMSDDNAWLLRNYLNAYTVLGDRLYREVSEGIISFIRQVLSDPAGGFYSSQDADVTPDDEGGYFIWTDDDFRELLSPEEYEILSLYMLHEAGSMHHDRRKKVLFAAMDTGEIAEKTGRDMSEIIEVVKRGKEKLLDARKKRQTPFIDKTLYTSINGMLISVFFLAYRVLKDYSLKDFAIKSLDKIMETGLVNNELFHTRGVKAFLDDYVHIIDALIAAYEATGLTPYIRRAEVLMDACLQKLWDRDNGGFFDTEEDILEMKIKGIEDIPHPSSNALCIRLFLKLYFITKRDVYYEYAEKALKLFSTKAAKTGIHAGFYFSAVDAYYYMCSLTLETPPGSELAEAAISLYAPLTSIVYGEDTDHILPCRKDICFEPVNSPDMLKNLFYSGKYLFKQKDE